MFRFLLFFLALVLGCSSSASSGAAGTSCKTTSDCSGGLSCVGLAVFNDGGCSTAGNACSKTCTTDGDCASLGAKFKCFAGCPGAPQTCGQTL